MQAGQHLQAPVAFTVHSISCGLPKNYSKKTNTFMLSNTVLTKWVSRTSDKLCRQKIMISFYLLLVLPSVQAADGWDDFSNNLATNLAPILSLFGGQITKQYLSESIYTTDYFIFTSAPIGIITAIGSAIRVCGSPSPRAFINRRQGRGLAKAEFYSSKSRYIYRLDNNGGITQVFSRPKILKLISNLINQDFKTGAARIYTFP